MLDPREGAFLDLSDRTKLRLSGADRIRFVNGQISNDIRQATASSAIAACVLNAKGKLNAHVFVSARDDSIFIDADTALRQTLPARLERYIIADDVQVEDVTAQFSIFHVLGKSIAVPDCLTISANRFGLPGIDVWVNSSRHGSVASALSTDVPFCNRECAEALRIEQGIPMWGRELTEEIIPVEANLEGSCIDYQKGCYIGQEVISRMKMSGQRNKSLCGLISVHNVSIDPSMRLYPVSPEKKEVGWITSAGFSNRLGKHIALAYIRRGFNHRGFQLDAVDSTNPAGTPAIRVEVVDLPFRNASPPANG